MSVNFESSIIIINELSMMIVKELKAVSSEQHYPSFDADNMDTIISCGQEKVLKFRKIREDFENITTGVIL